MKAERGKEESPKRKRRKTREEKREPERGKEEKQESKRNRAREEKEKPERGKQCPFRPFSDSKWVKGRSGACPSLYLAAFGCVAESVKEENSVPLRLTWNLPRLLPLAAKSNMQGR